MSTSTKQQREHAWGEIPEQLRERDQWIVTKQKGPVKPRKKWQYPDRQLSFQQACNIALECDGEPAFALRAEDPYVVLDFDDVRQSSRGHITEEIAIITDQLETYAENSRSGKGIHLVCVGSMLPDRNGKAELETRGEIEVYDSGQYIVLTGKQIGPFDSIRDFDESGVGTDNPLLELQRQYLPNRTVQVKKRNGNVECHLDNVSNQSTDLTPEEIKRTLEEYAESGSKEAKRAFNQWTSSAGSSCGFPSGSEADLSFISDLAFWCQDDAKLIDQCFRRSRRMRDKWDEIHYADGRTYGEATIQTAIRSNRDTFSGHHVKIS